MRFPATCISAETRDYFVNVQGDNQIAPTCKVELDRHGRLAGNQTSGPQPNRGGHLHASGGVPVVENTWSESGYAAVTLTVNNSTDCSFNGYMRDTATGTTGALSLVKTGTGSQTLFRRQHLRTPAERPFPAASCVLQDIIDSDFR